MTSMDVAYRYSDGLDADQIQALARLSDVYGIRGLRIDEANRRIAIEYDATRLDEPRVAALVRGCGVPAEALAASAVD